MRIIKESDISIDDVVSVLQKGGLVVFPTETLYGIGADATNANAVQKLNRYKKRPAGKPYSIAVCDISMARDYVTLNKSAVNIYNTFLPGPITVISKGKHKVAPGVESEAGTLGIRIPNYDFVIKLVKSFGKPITATSANASYKKRPYKISDILENISKKQMALIDLIIDAGELPHNDPSTVVDTTYDNPAVLRQGNIMLTDKNEILSRSVQETENCAKELWQKYEYYYGERAIVFALIGEMGSGKTIFTKGLAKAMGIKEVVTSPTYNLINSYYYKKDFPHLTHIDVWRIKDYEEVEDIGLQREISDRSVIAIEWADKVSKNIRKFNEEAVIIWVKIEAPLKGGENDRMISWGITN